METGIVFDLTIGLRLSINERCYRLVDMDLHGPVVILLDEQRSRPRRLKVCRSELQYLLVQGLARYQEP